MKPTRYFVQYRNARPDDEQAATLAIGRILGMMLRPNAPGDVEEYERCRSVVLNAIGDRAPDWTPNYARDRRLGAAGD